MHCRPCRFNASSLINVPFFIVATMAKETSIGFDPHLMAIPYEFINPFQCQGYSKFIVSPILRNSDFHLDLAVFVPVINTLAYPKGFRAAHFLLSITA